MGMFEILKKSYFKESLSLKAVVESGLWACTLSFAFYLFAAVFSSISDQGPEEKSMLKVKAQDTALPNGQGAGPQTQPQICMENHKPRVTATKPADQRNERSRRYGYSTLTFECQK